MYVLDLCWPPFGRPWGFLDMRNLIVCLFQHCRCVEISRFSKFEKIEIFGIFGPPFGRLDSISGIDCRCNFPQFAV